VTSDTVDSGRVTRWVALSSREPRPLDRRPGQPPVWRVADRDRRRFDDERPGAYVSPCLERPDLTGQRGKPGGVARRSRAIGTDLERRDRPGRVSDWQSTGRARYGLHEASSAAGPADPFDQAPSPWWCVGVGQTVRSWSKDRATGIDRRKAVEYVRVVAPCLAAFVVVGCGVWLFFENSTGCLISQCQVLCFGIFRNAGALF
jgi:hypothetical protein